MIFQNSKWLIYWLHVGHYHVKLSSELINAEIQGDME